MITRVATSLSICLTLVGAASAPVVAQVEAGLIRQVEFAGVYWGEPLTELKRELASRGFEISLEMGSAPNFDEEVEAALAKGLNTAGRRVAIIEARKQHEFLQIFIGAFPDGPRVLNARYEDGSNSGHVLASAKQKYVGRGLIFIEESRAGRFCVPSDRLRCDDYRNGPMMPYIVASENDLELRAGQDAEATYDKLFDDAVRQKLGQRKLSL